MAGAPARDDRARNGLDPALSGRLAHAVGLSRSGGSSILRSAGTIATWLAYILGGVALIFYAIP